jgi:hypothetical protein
LGNEVFDEARGLTRQLVPAMANMHAALVKLRLDEAVKVSVCGDRARRVNADTTAP